MSIADSEQSRPGAPTMGDFETRHEDMAASSQNATSNTADKTTQPPSDPPIADSVTDTLLPKLLRTTKVLLASRSFFFSYDYDITRRLGSQGAYNRDIPLHRIVDPLVS